MHSLIHIIIIIPPTITSDATILHLCKQQQRTLGNNNDERRQIKLIKTIYFKSKEFRDCVKSKGDEIGM